jgi:signal transduction histidine kinase
MVTDLFRSLWGEPRPADPPGRVRRDWVLLAVLVSWSILEAIVRTDLASPPLVLAAVLVVLASLLWRRTHPLVAVVLAFGTLTVVDIARILVADDSGLLTSIAGVLVLPYALFRWGAGREATIGLGVILAWLAVTHVADPVRPAEMVAGYAFFLLAAALGAAIRYHANARIRDIDEAKLREREQLARELHDTVAHHVSGIVIQAQAGRAVAPSHPERAVEALAVIEDAASRTLAEMRSMVRLLREAGDVDLAPQPGVADIQRLVDQAGGLPRIGVEFAGELDDLSPVVGAAVFRLAQEAITNARRHARHASQITVRVAGDNEGVHLTVDDDGVSAGPTGGHQSGYGLIGMRERAVLLGGRFEAGPTAGRGWRVDVILPRAGAAL